MGKYAYSSYLQATLPEDESAKRSLPNGSLLSSQPGPAIGAHLDLPQGLVHAAAHLYTCRGLQGLTRATAQGAGQADATPRRSEY